MDSWRSLARPRAIWRDASPWISDAFDVGAAGGEHLEADRDQPCLELRGRKASLHRSREMWFLYPLQRNIIVSRATQWWADVDAYFDGRDRPRSEACAGCDFSDACFHGLNG